MSHYLDLHSSRTTRALDAKSQRTSRFLPYIKNNKIHSVNFKVKSKRSGSKTSNQTHVRRYEQKQSVTVLSIRFASSEQTTKNDKDQEMYIKKKQKINEVQEQPEEQNKQDKLLPYLKYKKYESPEEKLKNMGYDPDVRIAAQVYSDKIEQRKIKYVNKIESLRRQLDNCNTDRRQNRMEKSRIQVKILGQEIRRKRQRQLLVQEERRGHRLLTSLLNPINSSQVA